MRKLALLGLTLAIVGWCAGAVLVAATATQPVTVNATVGSHVSFTFDKTTVNFTDQDPGSVPSITSADQIVISAKARIGKGATWKLEVLAGGDLNEGGGGVIPISNITWACASGDGFNATGTMNKTTAQAVGNWTDSGSHSGTQVYTLANSWTYATGSYTGTVTYTLTTP